MNRHRFSLAAVAALILGLLFLAPSAQAGWSQPIDISPSVSDEPEATSDAQVAPLPGGGYVYVWNKENQDGSTSVVSRIFRADGTLSPINNIVVGNYSGSTQTDPSYPTVATAADGTIRVAWTWTRINCSPSCDHRYEVQTAMLDEDGKLVPNSIIGLDITPPNSGQYLGPVSLSMAANGETLLAWRFMNWIGVDFKIRSATAEPGEDVLPAFSVYETSSSGLGDPAAAAAEAGGGFIAYKQDAQSLGGLIMAPNGAVSDPETLDPGDPNPVTVYEMSAFIDSSGTGTAVYRRGDTIQEQVFVRKMDSDGLVGSDPVMISENNTDRWSNFRPNGAVIASNGTIAVAWSQDLETGEYAARLRTIAANGNLGPIQTVAQVPNDGGAYYPSIALGPDGSGAVQYLEKNSDGDDLVKVRKLDAALVPTGTSSTLAGEAANSYLWPIGLAFSDDGTASALWADQLGGDWDLSGLRISIYETTPPEFVQTFIQNKALQGQGIVFAASATDRSGPVTYAWDFGDGGSAGTAIARHTFTTPGTYTVEVTATDGAGNASSESAQVEVIAASVDPPPDPIPPDTLINGKPAKKTKAKTATFKFVSSLAGSTFECRLDKAGWSSCKSPKRLKKLKPGKHTFKVRALKGDLFDATPATYGWTVKKAKKNKKGGRK